MPKLSDLGLSNEKIAGLEFDAMPDQRGGFGPPLYPGTYRFRLPKSLTAEMPIWDTMTTERGPRLNVLFEDAFALVIAQSLGGEKDGETFNARISAAERNRARKGEPEQLVSDLDYLLRDAFKLTARPKTNLEYAKALMQFAGKEFTADVEWNWYCNPKNDIRVDDGAGGTTQVEGQKGCGSRYYQGGNTGVQKALSDPNDPKSPLVWPERVECNGKDGVACGNLVRAYPNLRNFRA